MVNPAQPGDRSWKTGLLVSAALIAFGMLASGALREAGLPAVWALAVMAAFNLAGALIMDRSSTRDGTVVAAMALLVGLTVLPLLWVPDTAAWARGNPLTTGIIVVLASYRRRQYARRWPLFAIAAILGAAHIVISIL